MIYSIDKLENLGIFKSIPPTTASKFNRYNLIYGWNGSGKSTVSRLFSFLGGRTIPAEFANLKVTVDIDGTQYSEKQFSLIKGSIAVFNEDFIKDNIDWNGTINSILLLDEENIELVKSYSKLKEELYGNDNNKGLIKNIEEKKEILKKADCDLQKILTNIGKTVKNNYQLLDTGDTYYLNYDKRRVQDILNDTNQPLSTKDLLTAEELDSAIKKAKPIKKESIEIMISLINIEYLQKIAKETNEIAKRKVASKVIKELANNPSLASWVESGLVIHREEERTVCAFCGNDIKQERINDLESHFNNALNILKTEIYECEDRWKSCYCDIQPMFINTNIYYDEFEKDIKKFNEEYKVLSLLVNNKIDENIKLLEVKANNPFDIIENAISENAIFELVKSMNALLTKYSGIIKLHNTKTDKFEEITKKVKKSIERHYIKEQIIALSYDENRVKYEKDINDLKKEEIEKELKLKDYSGLESKLSNETLGAEEFNKNLERFLGYDEIKLVFDKSKKGYKILRNNDKEANNLSEGEKTAIAFIYFIIKLKENGRRIENSILVIDDPISSFDSNKIFTSYAYMKSECENAKQIFILTHNYNYFSLVLGWFNKKHTTIDVVTGKKKIPAYAIYRIENKIENDKRIAILSDGGDSLKQATEYDYVFYTVYSMKDKLLSKHESIFCGNVCRKLVESFLSFKFPKQRADLMALLQVALPGKEKDIVRERIYKFVNVYSHEKKIDVFEELDADILDANSQAIVADILSMIESLDVKHYEAMVEKVEKEL